MARNINKPGVDLVKEMEGFYPDAYRCPAGVWTIGYGHTAGVSPGQKVTKQQAEQLLREDLDGSAAAVERLISVPLTDNQFAALVSFTFNVGEGNLATSTLRRKLNTGDYNAVPSQLSVWVMATDPATGKKRPLNGLVRRRAAEGQLWLKPEGAAVADAERMPQKVEGVEDARVDGKVRSEVIARSGLRLRGGPGLQFGVIKTLPAGAVVYAGREQGEWIEIDLQGDGLADGWAFASYLRSLS